MKNSLIFLGSDELYIKFIEDLNSIMYYAFQAEYLPIQLTVGRLFVEMSCCHSIMVDLDIEDWKEACTKNREPLVALLNERVLDVMKTLEPSDGKLGDKGELDIYYHPDEPYISLYAVGISVKAEPNEKTTAEGLPIRKFSYKLDEFTKDCLH